MSSEQRELAKHEADDVVRALCLALAAVRLLEKGDRDD